MDLRITLYLYIIIKVDITICKKSPNTECLINMYANLTDN